MSSIRDAEQLSRIQRLSDLNQVELELTIKSLGHPAFRARQIHEWMFKRGVFDPAEMKNLPLPLRVDLAQRFPLARAGVQPGSAAPDGTQKLLFELEDKSLVESVYIPTEKRVTVCLSSQVGCAVRCGFCASGLNGGKRNLSRGEILEQFMAMTRLAATHERHITNLVMMGMGEPMFNYTNVFDALSIINSEEGPNLGARKITVSTIGIRAGVEKFTEARTQYTLAFSLHAPNDDIRREIVPLKSAMSVGEIRDAAERYMRHTGREVTFEYVMLDGLNSGIDHARELADRFQHVRGTFNLIPWNPVENLAYRRPSDGSIDRFVETLTRAGLKVSVRRRRGSEIDAACGQLALKSTRS